VCIKTTRKQEMKHQCGQCEFAEDKEAIAVAKYDDEYYCANCVCYNNYLQQKEGGEPLVWEWIVKVLLGEDEDDDEDDDIECDDCGHNHAIGDVKACIP
jgi:hypothetical protein